MGAYYMGILINPAVRQDGEAVKQGTQEAVIY